MKKWTDELILALANQCKTRKEFFDKFPQAYKAAARYGTLDNFCTHMPKSARKSGAEHPKFKWSFEAIKKVASVCETRGEFQKTYAGAYLAAMRREILDDVCGHMKISGNESFPEIFIKDFISNWFPSAQKRRSRNIKIEGKPWIKGFDLDILVPELNKAIEYDGGYHHSFEFMRACKGKKKWSDQDIRDYHKIKDSYFASIGIEVFHMRQEDYLKNPVEAAKKCLNFLKGVSEDQLTLASREALIMLMLSHAKNQKI